MAEFLLALARVSIVVFAVTSMLSVGLVRTLRTLLYPLRNWRGVTSALIANFVMVPLIAVAIAEVLPLPLPLKIGLFLAATGAGAPFLIKLTERADHDVGFAATLVVLLVPATVVLMPILVGLALPQANVSPWAIARPLALTLIVPLGVGLAARTTHPALAARLQPWMRRLSTLALLVLLVSLVVLNAETIRGMFGSGAVVACVLLTLGAFAAGGLAGLPPRPGVTGVLALGTAQRNIAAATVVAAQSFEDPQVLAMVVVTALVGLALLFPIAGRLREHVAAPGEPP